MNWITKLWKWIVGLFTSRKLHKCVCRSSCCDKSSMLVVYDEKEISDCDCDNSESDIEINSERESIKVK